jgi:hypothetical protein
LYLENTVYVGILLYYSTLKNNILISYTPFNYKNMKSILNLTAALFILLLLSSNKIEAQSMGISSTAITPDASSIVEMRTTDKGILIPRMTTTQRDDISVPATGLMIYNTSTNQYNFYNGGAWVFWGSAAYLSVDSGDPISTSSTEDVVITDMTKTALEAGTYSILFNGQVAIPEASYTTGFSTAAAAADLNLIYNDIMAIPVTGTHALTFGSGETLLPGVYNVGGAASIAGTLTLDGNNEPNALFIIRANAGAFNTAAGTDVILTNGATAENIFWVADGAIGLGANTNISGTLFSNGAAVAGGNSIVTGRLLTKLGAVSFGQGALTLPTDNSIIDFRSLSNFVIFTSSGGIANTGASVYNGDIGTGGGAITGFETATVNGTVFQSGSTTLVTPINHMATFSLYKNGVLISNSSRTRIRSSNPSDISLQGLTSVAVDDIIDVRWKIDDQDSDGIVISVLNRILTLIKVGN